MICPVPDPPMDKEDVMRFRKILQKHLDDDFSVSERKRLEEHETKSKENIARIIKNSGGKNPILGY